MKLKDLIARWGPDEGKPHKGKLFDPSLSHGNYGKPTDNLSCMCAHGQILFQAKADVAVAKLLRIALPHAVLLRHINDNTTGAPAIVLRDPQQILGDQWSKVLDFWWMADQCNEDEWEKISLAWVPLSRAAYKATVEAAYKAAGEAAYKAAGEAAGTVVRRAVRSGHVREINSILTEEATWEIQGFSDAPYILTLFGIKTLEDIPARPADYGLGVVPLVAV